MDMKLDLDRTGQVATPLEKMRALMGDLEAAIRLFPKLRKLDNLGDGVFRWELEPMGTAGISHAVVYASKYTVQLERGLVEWKPVAGQGNASLEGRWELAGKNGGTEIRFQLRGELRDLAAPLMLRPMVGPFVKTTLASLVDTYFERLGKAAAARP